MLFLVGSAVSAMAPTRAHAGGWAGWCRRSARAAALALVRAIARDAYSAEHLVKAIAYLTMFGTLGPMVSPFIGGVLTDMFGWRSVFSFALLAGGAITLTAYLVIYETHPAANRAKSDDVSVAQSYAALFRRPRFNAFVLQSGFTTGAFMVMASASASLMTELLHRPATEFGLYFVMFPIGFFTGNLHLQPDRQPGRGRDHGADRLAAGDAHRFGPGARAVERRADLRSRSLFRASSSPWRRASPCPTRRSAPWRKFRALPERRAGVGVFMQNFAAALFSQLYGVLADGTPMPMSMIALLCATLCALSARCRSC